MSKWCVELCVSKLCDDKLRELSCALMTRTVMTSCVS